jgi:hypothetical protein
MDGVNYFLNIFANFVNPDIHTQNIENMWMRVKRKLRRQLGTSRALFKTYLSEFGWRNFHRNDDNHHKTSASSTFNASEYSVSLSELASMVFMMKQFRFVNFNNERLTCSIKTTNFTILEPLSTNTTAEIRPINHSDIVVTNVSLMFEVVTNVYTRCFTPVIYDNKKSIGNPIELRRKFAIFKCNRLNYNHFVNVIDYITNYM